MGFTTKAQFTVGDAFNYTNKLKKKKKVWDVCDTTGSGSNHYLNQTLCT